MSSTKCPKCGGYKKPWFGVCYNCHKSKNNFLYFIIFTPLVLYLIWESYKEEIVNTLIFIGKLILVLIVGYVLYWILFKQK